MKYIQYFGTPRLFVKAAKPSHSATGEFLPVRPCTCEASSFFTSTPLFSPFIQPPLFLFFIPTAFQHPRYIFNYLSLYQFAPPFAFDDPDPPRTSRRLPPPLISLRPSRPTRKNRIKQIDFPPRSHIVGLRLEIRSELIARHRAKPSILRGRPIRGREDQIGQDYHICCPQRFRTWDSESKSVTTILYERVPSTPTSAIMNFLLWILTSFVRWIRLKIYQYEVTFALYMLTPTEKFIFSTYSPRDQLIN